MRCWVSLVQGQRPPCPSDWNPAKTVGGYPQLLRVLELGVQRQEGQAGTMQDEDRFRV